MTDREELEAVLKYGEKEIKRIEDSRHDILVDQDIYISTQTSKTFLSQLRLGNHHHCALVTTTMSISFEPPLHPMCVEHWALLISRDLTTSYFDFDKGNLSQCPEMLRIDDRKYRYQGVQDGRAIYREDGVDE